MCLTIRLRSALFQFIALSLVLAGMPAAVKGQPSGAWTPDAVFAGTDGILYLVHNPSLSVCRWNPASRSYLSDLRLTAPVVAAGTHGTATPGVFLARPGGSIVKFDTTQLDPVETELVPSSGRLPLALLAFQNHLFVAFQRDGQQVFATYHGGNGAGTAEAGPGAAGPERDWTKGAGEGMLFSSDADPGKSLIARTVTSSGAITTLPINHDTGGLGGLAAVINSSYYLMRDGRRQEASQQGQTGPLRHAVYRNSSLMTMNAYDGDSILTLYGVAATYPPLATLTLRGVPLGVFNISPYAVAVTLLDGIPEFTVFSPEEQLARNFFVDPPAVHGITAPQAVYYGEPFTLEPRIVGATGPLAFQWLRDGIPLPGETNQLLHVDAAGSSHEGRYSVVITSTSGTAASEETMVQVGFGFRPGISPLSDTLLVTGSTSLWKYAFDGTYLGAFPLPVETTGGGVRRIHDLVTDDWGRIHIVSTAAAGTPPAILSTWYPTFDRWIHRAVPFQQSLVSPPYQGSADMTMRGRFLYLRNFKINVDTLRAYGILTSGSLPPTVSGPLEWLDSAYQRPKTPGPDVSSYELEGIGPRVTALGIPLRSRVMFYTDSAAPFPPSGTPLFLPEPGNRAFMAGARTPAGELIVASLGGDVWMLPPEAVLAGTGISLAPVWNLQGVLPQGYVVDITARNTEGPFEVVATAATTMNANVPGPGLLAFIPSGTVVQLPGIASPPYSARVESVVEDLALSASLPGTRSEVDGIWTDAATEDQTYSGIVRISRGVDPFPVLEFSIPQKPDWLSVNAGSNTLTFTGTPLAADSGMHRIEIVVTDPVNGMRLTVEFRIRVDEVNDAPAAARPLDTITVLEDAAPLLLDAAAFFIDEETPSAAMTYTWSVVIPSPALQPEFAPDGGNLSTLHFPQDQSGAGLIEIRATDAGGLTASTRREIIVQPVPDAPVAAVAKASVSAGPAAADALLDLKPLFTDADPGDFVSWSLPGETRSPILSAVNLDGISGELRFSFAPYVAGSAVITVRGTDQTGRFADLPVEVTLPALPPPAIAVTQGLRLNRQTGLVELTVVLTNNSQRALGGFELRIDGLPAGVCLYNGSSCEDGSGVAGYYRPVDSGATVTLQLQFLSPQRDTGWTPSLTAVPALPAVADSGSGGFQVDRCLVLPDGAVLIEFPADPGASYQVEYSDGPDSGWTPAGMPLRAGGTRVQWIDRGLPATSSLPAEGKTRLYRVRKL